MKIDVKRFGSFGTNLIQFGTTLSTLEKITGVTFWPEIGQTREFSDRISVHFGSSQKNEPKCTKTDLKKSQSDPICKTPHI